MPMQSMTDLLSDRPYATMFQDPPNRAAYRFRDRKRPIRNDKKNEKSYIEPTNVINQIVTFLF